MSFNPNTGALMVSNHQHLAEDNLPMPSPMQPPRTPSHAPLPAPQQTRTPMQPGMHGSPSRQGLPPIGYFATSSYGPLRPQHQEQQTMMHPPMTPPGIPTGSIYRRYDPAYTAPVGTSHNHYADFSPPTKRALMEQSDNFSKRIKIAHEASEIDLGAKQTNQIITGLPASPEAAPTPNPDSNTISAVTTPAAVSTTTPEESSDLGPPGIEWLEVDPADAPPKSLELKIKPNCVACAAKTLHVAGVDFLDYEELIKENQTMVVKPNPRGSDKGLPVKEVKQQELTEEENGADADADPNVARKAAIKDDAKLVYNAIYDNSYFWSSKQYGALLRGEVDDAWIAQRSYDIVHKSLELHEDGLLVTKWTNKDNLVSNAKNATDVKSDAEINDTYETRMTDIRHALRYHKAIAWDVIKGVDTLDHFILAPKAQLQTKLNYKASNTQRGQKYDDNKQKAKKFDEQEKAREVTTAN